MVLADAVERGEVSLDTTVAAILPEHEGTPFGSITLEEMCTHTSGLPKLPRSVVTLRRILLFVLFGRDPRRHISAEAVLAAGARQKLHGRGQYRYSNLGGAIAGQLLAVAAGCDYSTLLKERPCRPLGIRSTTVAERGAWEAGWSAQSRRCQPWLPDGYAPAAGVLTTIADLRQLAIALLGDTAPGTTSLRSLGVAAGKPGQAGMFWMVDSAGPGRTATRVWHNEATGGYAA